MDPLRESLLFFIFCFLKMVDYFGRSKNSINSIEAIGARTEGDYSKQFLRLDDLEDVYDFSKQAEEDSLYCFKALANGLYKREKLPFALGIDDAPNNIPLNIIKRNRKLFFK